MRQSKFSLRILLLGILCFSFVALFFIVKGVSAAPASQTPQPSPDTGATTGSANNNLSIADDVCLGCHGQPGINMTLENGDVWDLYIPAEMHNNSVHGQAGYACVQCHVSVGEYPHPTFKARNLREASLQLYLTCERCHAQQYNLTNDSVHTKAQNSGNNQAAVCADCHTAHDVQRIYEPQTKNMLLEARVWIPLTCARCHSAIYEKYQQSVHGSALIGQGDPFVPTCTDCHGSHSIENPTTAAFRLRSPEICSKCHTDPAIMDRYGISTQVLDTYVADFHGTTQTLFEPGSPDAPFNKPVCYDCHGVHDIASKDDPKKSLLVRENLLAKCQVCHPDASANFPTAWLSHYIPSPEKYPVVYYVTLFYKFLIPITLGGMAALVMLDFGRLSLNRFRQGKQKSNEASQNKLQRFFRKMVNRDIQKAAIEPEPTHEIDQSQFSVPEETEAGNAKGDKNG